eukprot:55021_1
MTSKVPKKYLDEWDDVKDSGYSPTRTSKVTKQQQFKTYRHHSRPKKQHHTDRHPKQRFAKRNTYGPNYYYVPFEGRITSEHEKGTLSAMPLMNKPDLLKLGTPITIITSHHNLCFFKMKNLIDNYLIELNDTNLKIVSADRIREVKRKLYNLNEIPIQYPAREMEEYKLSTAVSLNRFRPKDFDTRLDKCAMSAFMLKEIAQKYERKCCEDLLSDFMCTRSPLTDICHVLMSNIKPGRYQLQDPLNVLIWSEDSIPSIDPSPWNRNIIQLHSIATEEASEPEALSDNPNAMYGHLFEHILTDATSKTYKYMEMSDESNAFLFSKLNLLHDKDHRMSILLMSEQDCRTSRVGLTEIKLSKMYSFQHHRGGVSLNSSGSIRIPFWKFISYWLQCYFAHDDHIIIGFHENGKIVDIIKTSFEQILERNTGLKGVIAFIKYGLYKVLKWIKQCITMHPEAAPLLLKTQLAIDKKGNEYNQLIIKPFGGAYVSKLDLTKLLEYGQKTHNVYFDEEKRTFRIEQVNFCYVNNIVRMLEKMFMVTNDNIGAKTCRKKPKLIHKSRSAGSYAKIRGVAQFNGKRVQIVEYIATKLRYKVRFVDAKIASGCFAVKEENLIDWIQQDKRTWITVPVPSHLGRPKRSSRHSKKAKQSHVQKLVKI